MTRDRQLRIKPYQGYDPTKKPRTPAQEVALRRTWRIIQLRSLWTLSLHVKTRWRLWLIRRLLDDELASMGAERHGVRYRRQRAEFQAEVEVSRRERQARYDAIPF